MKHIHQSLSLIILCVLTLLPSWAVAQAPTIAPQTETISLSSSLAWVDEGEAPKSKSPYADPGHIYSYKVNGWTIRLIDAKVDATGIEVFTSGYLHIDCDNTDKRLRSVQFDSFEETLGTYIHGHTQDGTLDKGTGVQAGSAVYTDKVWSARFPDTQTELTFIMVNRDGPQKGSVRFTGNMTITYGESADFPQKEFCELKIERPQIEVPINQNIVTEPTVTVRDKDGNRISQHFAIMYFIEGEPIHDINEDHVTGSTVKQSDGTVVTGGRLGEFTIHVRCFPITEEASRKYTTRVATYKVKVTGRRGIVNVNGENREPGQDYDINIYKGVPIKSPQFKVMDATGQVDISQYYKIDLATLNFQRIEGEAGTAEFINNYEKLEGKKLGQIRGRVTFQPKDEYINTYDAATCILHVTVFEMPTDAQAHVVLRSNELKGEDEIYLKRNNLYFNELVLRVYDNYNNDVSDYYDMSPQAVKMVEVTNSTQMFIRKMTQDEANSNNRLYANDPDYIPARAGDPIFVSGSATGMDIVRMNISKTADAPAIFKNVTKDVKVYIVNNEPDIRFVPEKLVLRKGQTWNSRSSVNPFVVRAYEDLRSFDRQYTAFTYNVSLPTGTTGISYDSNYKYYSSPFANNRNRSFSITANAEGTYYVNVRVTPDDPRTFDATTARLEVQVLNKVQPVVKFSESRLVVRKGQAIIEPVLTITDAQGEDLSSDYTVRYSASLVSDNGYRYDNAGRAIFQSYTMGTTDYSADGKINTDATTSTGNSYMGTYTIRATLTPKDAVNFEAASTSYDLVIYQSNWHYKVVTEKTNPDYGEVYFDKDGLMAAGNIIDGVPGLEVQFGAQGRDYWEVKPDDEESFFVSNNTPVELDPYALTQVVVPTVKEDGTVFNIENIRYKPVRGGFLKLLPASNGFVTVDALWEKDHRYVLAITHAEGVDYQVYIPEETQRKPHRFETILSGGNVAYLYEDSQTDVLKVYGFNFDPAFVATTLDTKAVTEAVAYLNWTKDGNTETKQMKMQGLPHLSLKTSKYVSYDIEANYKDAYAAINTTTGTLTLNQTTDGQPQGSHNSVKVPAHEAPSQTFGNIDSSPVAEQRIRVYGKVESADKVNAAGVVKWAWYDLLIGSINAYHVPEGFTPDVQQEIKDVPGITMTWGGWSRQDQIAYEYNKEGQSYTLQDSWKEAAIDNYAADNGTVEGYLYSSEMGGNSNAKDELAQVWTPEKASVFGVPCRGDYVTFKPTKQGVLYIYVLQKGCSEWNGVDQINPKKNNVIRWRPLFIVDDRGEGVPLKKSADVFSTEANASLGYFTHSRYRSDKDGNGLDGAKLSAYFTEWKDGLTEARLNFLRDNWGNVGDRQKVISLDELPEFKAKGMKTGGHAIMSKGFVRYTIDVLPGKTYYVYQTGSKMGFAGFAFDAQHDQAATAQELYSNTSQSYRTTTVQAHADVTLKGKKIIKDRWNALTLPFSMNEAQVEQTFGKGTRITVFKDVDEQASTTGRIYFTEHRYQHVVAGLPMLIWPTFEGTGLTMKTDTKNNAEYVDEITMHDVSITKHDNDAPFKLHSVTTPGYTMEPIYEVTADKEIHVGDYYMSWGTLIHSNYGNQSGTFNAVLRAPAATAPAKMAMFVGDFLEDEGIEQTAGTTTGIDELEATGTTTLPAGVYNLQGQRVADDLRGLSQGVYIYNGKKVIIK